MKDKEKIHFDAIVYAIYAGIIPLNMVLNFTGFTVNKYIGIMAILCMTFYSFILKRKKIKKTILPAYLFTWSALFTIFWSLNKETSIHMFKTLISLVLLFTIFVLRDFNFKEKKLIQDFMIIGAVLLIFWMKPNQAVSYSRFTITTSAGFADQNGLAANILFTFFISINLLFQAKDKKNKIYYTIVVLIIFLEIILIGSRGSLLAMVICIFSYFLFLKKVKISWYNYILVIFLVIVLFFYFQKEFPELISRFSLNAIKEDGGSGRNFIWKNVLKFITLNPLRILFGYGYGCEGEVCLRAFNMKVGIHNVFLEHFSTMGVLGLGELILIFYSGFYESKRRRDYLSIILLIALVVVSVPLGFFLNKGAWNILALSYSGMKKSSNDGSNRYL